MRMVMRMVMMRWCKVVIPGGTERSYGICWRSEMRVTDET